MSKKHLVLAFALFAIFSVAFVSCKKDNNPPTISLLGDNPQTVTLQGSYVEAGATANDPEDGDISSSITIDASDVDENTAGSYEVFYSVTDADGNTESATRTVNVQNSAISMEGNYTVVDSSSGLPPDPSYSENVSVSNVVNNRIGFSKFANYSNNGNIYATISGNSITIPTQTAIGIGAFGDNHRFSGTGVKSSNGFILTFTDENLTVSSSTNTVSVFVKQ